MRSPLDGLRAARALGWRQTGNYLRYQLELRSGLLRVRTPLRSWADFERDLPQVLQCASLLFDGSRRLQLAGHAWSDAARAQAQAEAEAVLAGRFRLFGLHQLELGFPPDWNRFPPLPGAGGGGAVAADRHWTGYDLEAMAGDVKLLWEPSRFAWAFALGRAYAWTADPRYPVAFWQLLTSWRDSNPPNQGPQWVSAQEVALRLLALAFAREAFAGWFAERPERARTLAATVAAHAARIPPTLAYSRAQGNNHLLAEGVGLLSAGLLLARLPQADGWREQGRAIVESALQVQVMADGGYVQHSTNYQRLALELGLWAAALAEHSGEPLGRPARGALRRCAALLAALTEPERGRAPNYGPNDGAQLLPLSSCDYQDYRPALQAAAAALGGLPSWGEGPWDETARWLGFDPTAGGGEEPARRSFPHAGLTVIGQGPARAVLRAARFRSRPGHLDQLQLDLWHGGSNLAQDPGTYLYNGAPPWDNRLAQAAVHNAPVVDGREPMRRVSRFLWLDWSAAHIVEQRRSSDGALELLAAEHDGYEKLGVRQRRTVIRAGERRWLVFDDLLATARHLILLAWLLPDGEARVADDELLLRSDASELQLRVGPGSHALYRAGERVDGPAPPYRRPQWGWRSPTYARREPALHWLTWYEGPLPLRLRSEWVIGAAAADQLELEWGRRPVRGLPPLHAVRYGPSVLELGD